MIGSNRHPEKNAERGRLGSHIDHIRLSTARMGASQRVVFREIVLEPLIS